MRVLHILNELKPSGAELMYVSAAEMWRDGGVECDILSTGEEPGILASRMAEVGFHIHHIPFRRSPRFMLKVAVFLRRQRYDVVHIDAERASFWYSVAAYMAGSGKLFRTIHSTFPFSGLLRLRRGIQRFIMRRIGVQMISVSASVQRNEAQNLYNQTRLIFNWFDDRIFTPASPETRSAARRSWALPEDAMVITSVGNCGSPKNHEAILNAIAECASSMQVTYMHVGQEDIMQSERKLAERLGIFNKVKFIGVLEPQNVAEVLHGSDVFVMPSEREGFSCSAIEALAVGIPAILADVCGLQDLKAFIPGIRWIEPTAESLVSALRKLQTAPAEESRASQISATYREFSRSKGAITYLELYNNAEDDSHS